MLLKKRYLFLILIVCLFAISAVSAAEINNETNMVANDYDSSLMAESVNENTLSVSLSEKEIQGSADNGTFTALQKKINEASEGSIINLENNYTYDSGFSTDGITINKTLTINGNGYTIDALGESRIFYITSPTVTLNNITLKNGYTTNQGGAIYFADSVSNSCISGEFIGNIATLDGFDYGGGAICFSSDVFDSIVCGEFINNTVTSNGGAISFHSSVSNSTISGEFINNTASSGGAIYFSGSVSNSNISGEFINNTASSYGGAISFGGIYNSNISGVFTGNTASSSGGAISFRFFDSNFSISGVFTGNTASSYGGAIYGCLYYSSVSCEFINNTAGYEGGAIFLIVGRDSIITDCGFINNSAKFGGAVYYTNSIEECNMTNCSFMNNSAKSDGGAIYIEEGYGNIFSDLSFINNTAIRGGAIFSTPAGMYGFFTIKNSDFINNSADNGSSIYILEKYGYGIEAEIFDSYFYTIENKELIYSLDSLGYLFLQNNTMVSPISYKIYSTPDRISSKKYLILENETCYINTPFAVAYTDDNVNKIRLDADIPIILTDLNNNLSFIVNATFDSASGFYYTSFNQSGVYNLGLDTKFSNNLTAVPAIWEIHSVKPDLSINVNNRSYSENTTFTVKVTSEEYLVNTGNINFYIDEKKVGSAIVSNGLAIFNYAYPKVGTFSILAIYEENDNYLSANMTALFTVNKMPTVLSAESVIFDEKDDKIFTAELKDNNSICVSGQNVKIETIKYSGESQTFNGITDIEGIAKYNVKNLEGGMWFVTGTYDGNGNYINSKFSDKFIVIRMDTTTNITGIDDSPKVNHTYKLKANIHDENGKLVKEGIVKFYLDGVDIGSIDLSKNKLSKNDDLLGAFNLIFDCKLGDDDSDLYIEYTPSKAGTYTLSAVYEGTTIYRASNETTTLIVKEEDSFILSAPDVTKYYGGPERFIVTLKDLNGNPIKNAVVKITINGRTSDRTTDDNGIASMGINLNSGVYITTTEYNGTKVNSTVTVKDTVIAKDFSKIFRNGTQYQGTFVDSQGNLIRNTDIEININGVFYTRKTNDNGVAQMNINLPPCTYILTATNPLSKEQHTTKVTVLPNIVENYDLTKYYKNASQYSLRLLDDKGNPVGAGVSIQLNINGVFYTRTSDANGYVKMNINLPPGTYIITAEYKGLRASNTIKVLSVLETKDLIMKYKDGSKFEAKVLDGQGKPYAGQTVTFNINGVFYTKTTEADGIARLKINLLAGEYIITSMYNGLNSANKVTISG